MTNKVLDKEVNFNINGIQINTDILMALEILCRENNSRIIELKEDLADIICFLAVDVDVEEEKVKEYIEILSRHRQILELLKMK